MGSTDKPVNMKLVLVVSCALLVSSALAANEDKKEKNKDKKDKNKNKDKNKDKDVVIDAISEVVADAGGDMADIVNNVMEDMHGSGHSSGDHMPEGMDDMKDYLMNGMEEWGMGEGYGKPNGEMGHGKPGGKGDGKPHGMNMMDGMGSPMDMLEMMHGMKDKMGKSDDAGNYFVGGDFIVNHGIINNAVGMGAREMMAMAGEKHEMPFGRWFVRCMVGMDDITEEEEQEIMNEDAKVTFRPSEFAALHECIKASYDEAAAMYEMEEEHEYPERKRRATH